jgi:hypothetical protein
MLVRSLPEISQARASNDRHPHDYATFPYRPIDELEPQRPGYESIRAWLLRQLLRPCLLIVIAVLVLVALIVAAAAPLLCGDEG